MSTTVSKFSVSMPSYIYKQLAAQLGKREVSGFIANAVEEKMLTAATQTSVEAFIALRHRLPKLDERTIRTAIGRGRI